jgi:hypothetical protein|tara:strand:+ start:143 stop:505 length:363 start_codon:yes stop_codon:yes gene_type:complete
MKFTPFIFLVALLAISFATGQYFTERGVAVEKMTNTIPKIVVTEILLNEYLTNCDKPGYRRFSSFHEHNIDKVLREIEYSVNSPYFLESDFVAEMTKLYSSHKTKHEAFKKHFLENCGEV